MINIIPNSVNNAQFSENMSIFSQKRNMKTVNDEGEPLALLKKEKKLIL